MEDWPGYWAETPADPLAPMEIALALLTELNMWRLGAQTLIRISSPEAGSMAGVSSPANVSM